MTKETRSKYGEGITVIEVEGAGPEDDVFARAHAVLDHADDENVGFVLVGPMVLDGVQGTTILTPLDTESTIMVLQGALDALKGTMS